MSKIHNYKELDSLNDNLDIKDIMNLNEIALSIKIIVIQMIF